MSYIALREMQMPESCQSCPLNIFDFCIVAPDDVDSEVSQACKDGCRSDWCPLALVDGIEIKEELS